MPTPIAVDEDQIGDDGEAELTEWLAPDGARVTAGAAVAELSTAKAILEVAAPASGVLRQLVAVGAVIRPRQPIGEIVDG